MRRSERHALIAIAVVSLILRAVAFFHYRFDSDEGQHLHVVWGWTAGLVQYRDVFDNHTPLFHILSTPLLAALGERPDILLLMRAPMIALFAIVIACTYYLGRTLYSPRVGAWAAVLLSLVPTFFLKTLEYRNDNLVTALWIVAVVLVVRRQMTIVRAAVAGLLIGAAFAASFKTVLLIFAIGAAGMVLRVSFSRLAAMGLAMTVVPALTIAYFASIGAVRELIYYSFEYNAAVPRERAWSWIGWIVFPIGVFLIAMAARRRKEADPLRLFAGLTLAFFLLAFYTLWPVISPRDLLPVMPIGAVLAVASTERIRWYVGAAALFVASLFHYADGFMDRTDEHITMMNQVLRLTRPGELLMDVKGETIYRRRPFYYGFETVTRKRMKLGWIPDTVPEEMIRKRCYVAQAEGPMLPDRARTFMNEHYMDLGRLRAAGQWIRDDGSFDIAVPGPYVVVNTRGVVTPRRELSAGRHQVERSAERRAVVWAPAIERGFSPFHLKDRDF